MINASKEFRQVIHERTDFKESARITFKDGRILDLQDDDFTVSGNTVSDSVGSSSFPLGVAVGRVIQLQIFNDNDRLSSYDFYGAVIDLRLSLELSNGPEILNFGTYTVIEPETYGETVTIQAMDNMYKADKDYSTSLNFPVSLGSAVADSAQSCGISLLTTAFKNDDFMIRQAPEGITHRTFLAMAAMIACGYARIDYNGRLCIESYDFSVFNEGIADLDGGIFDGNTPYSSGDDADGGAFNPWNTGYEYDSGIFSQMDNYHVFFEFGTLTVSTDDVVITGIETTVDETRYLSGSEGYTLNIENQLISGQEQAALDLIGKSIIGIRFRPFEGDHIAYPLAEFGDLAYVIDRKNNAYQTVLTDINFEWNNVTTLKCSADSPLRNSSRYNSQLTQAIVTARKDAEKQLSNYDMAVKDMTSIMANSLGLFESYEETENGGRIAYQHNKPNREDSDIIWKKSEQGFQVSTDGGKTWNAGMTADGKAVVNVLSAVGILFDWARGGTLTLGGYGNGDGRLEILNASGAQIGYVDNTGVHFDIGTISASLIKSDTMSANRIRGGVLVLGGSQNANGRIVILNGSNFERIFLDNNGVQVNGSTTQSRLNQGRLYFSYNEKDVFMAGPMRHTGFNNVEIYGAVLSSVDNSGLGNCFSALGVSNSTSSAAPKLVATGNTNYRVSIDYTGGASVDLWEDIEVFGGLISQGAITAGGELGSFGPKNRIARTPNYDFVKLYCYETNAPMFGDIGAGVTDENGVCVIFLDDIFGETISNMEYYVFLQKESEGDIWVEEKNKSYFMVKGSPNLKFSWEIKATQRDYEMVRHENFVSKEPSNEIDHAQQYMDEFEKYFEELEAVTV